MSTTITIPSELAMRIAERAAAEGKSVEEFVLETLWRVVETPSLRKLFAETTNFTVEVRPTREEMHERGKTSS